MSKKVRLIYLVVASSGRAIAKSLQVIGSSAVVIDGYADMDTQAASHYCKKVKRTKYSLDTAQLLDVIEETRQQYKFENLLYGSVVETEPDLLDAIVIDKIIGNTSQTIRKCKSAKNFFSVLDKHAIPYPEVSFTKPVNHQHLWLTKSAKTTGGIGVSFITEDISDEADYYFQKVIEGINFSLTFLASDEVISPVGFNTLWAESFGDHLPYVYSGAINTIDICEKDKSTAIKYSEILTREFNLVGLNTIDFIFANNSVYVLEINPRITATFDLHETRHGELLKRHIDACLHHKLPDRPLKSLLRAHKVVYAPADLQIPKSITWPLWTADRPHPGDMVLKHEPICNIFAGGQNTAQVRDMIRVREKTILDKLINKNE